VCSPPLLAGANVGETPQDGRQDESGQLWPPGGCLPGVSAAARPPAGAPPAPSRGPSIPFSPLQPSSQTRVPCSLNSSLNLLNKWSLGVYGFRFPFLLTSCECGGRRAHSPASPTAIVARPRNLGWLKLPARFVVHVSSPSPLNAQSGPALPTPRRPHGLQFPGACPGGAAGALGGAPPHTGEAVAGGGLHRGLHGPQHCAQQYLLA
jgi:hypothetical protein